MTTYKDDAEGIAHVREAFAYGVLNMVMFAENEAKRRAPVDTGNLRRSIHSVVFDDGRVIGRHVEGDKPIPDYATGAGIVGYVGTNCGYGVYQEFGTRFMAAHPFLRPAFDAMLARKDELLKAGMGKHMGGSA